MFSLFWHGVQQDFKLFLLAPVLCAMFRLAFILVYRPKKTPTGEWRKWAGCFRYGFWWGMDFNAYVFLYLVVLVSLPGMFLPGYYAVADWVSRIGVTAYLLVLYVAFAGKMIFYYHFHDTFNPLVKLGRHADKKNFADIFFHQNHGTSILIGLVLYVIGCWKLTGLLLVTPTIPYPDFSAVGVRYGFNALLVVGSIVLFYWFRYGGTLRHRKKPEWDEVPPLVKNDTVLGKATVDDLIAFELAIKRPVSDAVRHSDEEAAVILKDILPQPVKNGENPLLQFRRESGGARMAKPSHIFFLLGESHAQAPFDPIYRKLHLMEASERFRRNLHTISFSNFLPGGMISQPSLVSLLAGIYDADMELNENTAFWEGTLPTALPVQMHRLGYRTEFWYGGGLNWGSLDHFAPAIGFDACHGGPDICPEDAPRTWLGIYDHIFLQEAAKRIKSEKADGPVFHFLYTTSNHGPYNMPYEEMGFDIERVMPEAPEKLKKDHKLRRQMGGIWYADQALIHFAEDMMKTYPDSLIIVTGDHATGLIPFQCGVVKRREPSLRDCVLTSFAISHPELDSTMFAGNTIGGHMNILPTLIELIAPEGFPYYSLVPSLLEPIDHVVTPYCWETRDTLGDYRDGISQSLAVSEDMLPVAHDSARFEQERAALCELTGWIVRHPELLIQAGKE